jgi:hypothetical protein
MDYKVVVNAALAGGVGGRGLEPIPTTKTCVFLLLYHGPAVVKMTL